jgi:G3E family GTPase
LGTRIPVTVVGGYLGAGKTTLVNHLLRNADGLRLAVLVNDFGTLPIDADLIEAQSDNLISIAGGCVCCSFGSDLMGALMSLAQRDPAPDHVLLETSGVAMPGVVARSAALIPAFAIDSVVVLADAETVRARAADRYMGDTITRQLNEADLVILNKSDLVSAGAMQLLQQWMAHSAPRAALVDAERGEVSAALIFGRGHTTPAPGMLSPRSIRPAENAAGRYESASFSPAAPVQVETLARALADPVCGVLRAKGVLRDVDGSLKTLHVVGARFEVTPFGGGGDAVAGIVCIGLRGRVNHAAIEHALVISTLA